VSNTGTFNFKPNDEDALEIISEYGQNCIVYKNGYPDFTPFSIHDSCWGKIDTKVEIPHMTTARKNEQWEFGRRPKNSSHNPAFDIGNFSQADNEMAIKLVISSLEFEKFRKDAVPKLVWHECEDGKTMMLVPKSIHEKCPHSGGVSEMSYRMAWGDIDADFGDDEASN
jgi:hypothetical protein